MGCLRHGVVHCGHVVRRVETVSAPNMLFKELLAPTVAALLIGPHCPDLVFASAADNAGTTFTLNSLSCICHFSLELLRPLSSSLEFHRFGLVEGHTHRCHNQHADDLSHILTSPLWRVVLAQTAVTKKARMEVHFLVHDLWGGGVFAATMSFERPIRLTAKSVNVPSCPVSSSVSD